MKQIWGRIKLYGGKLAENITQAVAADLITYGATEAIKEQFDLFVLVHDQALAMADERPKELFAEALTRLPAWAKGLPLKADCKIVSYYSK
jgi:DNA polymerase